MRRLFILEAPADFRPSHDLVAGAWCFQMQPEKLRDWSRNEFPVDPTENGTDRKISLDKCAKVAQSLIEKHAAALNSKSQGNRSLDVWWAGTNFWAISFVQFVYVLQEYLHCLVSTYGSTPIQVWIPDRTEASRFRDTAQFCAATWTRDFTAEVFANLLEKNLPSEWEIKHLVPSLSYTRSDDAIQGTKIGVLKQLLREWLRRVSWRLTPRFIGVKGISFIEALMASIFLGIAPVAQRERSSESQKSQLVHGGRSDEQHEDIFQFLGAEVVDELFWRYLPKIFLAPPDQVDLGWRPVPGRSRVVGIFICMNEPVKFTAARCRAQGERIIGVQHGAAYGDARQSLAPYIEYNLDSFITWGWDAVLGHVGRFIPLPQPMLSSHQYSGCRENGILWVSFPVNFLNRRFDSSPGRSGLFRYMEMKHAFLANLDVTTQASIKYRPMPMKGALDDFAVLNANFPHVAKADSFDMSRLMGAGLLLMDNPSTTLHIALAGNVPTICFWNPRDWEMTEAANSYYDVLRAAGILFDSATEAASALMEVWPNVKAWWWSGKVQAARLEWVTVFARTNPRWRLSWAKALVGGLPTN